MTLHPSLAAAFSAAEAAPLTSGQRSALTALRGAGHGTDAVPEDVVLSVRLGVWATRTVAASTGAAKVRGLCAHAADAAEAWAAGYGSPAVAHAAGLACIEAARRAGSPDAEDALTVAYLTAYSVERGATPALAFAAWSASDAIAFLSGLLATFRVLAGAQLPAVRA